LKEAEVFYHNFPKKVVTNMILQTYIFNYNIVMQPEEQTQKPTVTTRHMYKEHKQALTNTYNVRLPYQFDHPNLQPIEEDHEYVKLVRSKWHHLTGDTVEMPKNTGFYRAGYLPIPGKGITNGIFIMEYEEACSFDVYQISVQIEMENYSPSKYKLYFLDRKLIYSDDDSASLASIEEQIRTRPGNPFEGGDFSGNL
jgi:hypothetical protein